jgi:signal peptidase I
MHEPPPGAVLAFDNPWHITALIALAVVLRLWCAHSRLFVLSVSLRNARGAVLEFIDSALIALLLVFCILRPFVVQAFYIPSGSMEWTLQENDRILVNKFVYHFREPEPGDIVVFKAPPAANHFGLDFIKRVVGVSGDELRVVAYDPFAGTHNDGLYRNGQLVDEPYIKERPMYNWPEDTSASPVEVPQNHIVVFGDNRNDSNDSHRWHTMTPLRTQEARPFVPQEDVLGKAMVIFWPLNRIRVVH